jgi:hypothetical protein
MPLEGTGDHVPLSHSSHEWELGTHALSQYRDPCWLMAIYH